VKYMLIIYGNQELWESLGPDLMAKEFEAFGKFNSWPRWPRAVGPAWRFPVTELHCPQVGPWARADLASAGHGADYCLALAGIVRRTGDAV